MKFLDISIKTENGKQVVRNKNIKIAKKMIQEVLNNLKEGVEIYESINDLLPKYEYKEMLDNENDIKSMQDMIDEIKNDLELKKYLKDTSILPSLTIKGRALLEVIAEENIKRQRSDKPLKCERNKV